MALLSLGAAAAPDPVPSPAPGRAEVYRRVRAVAALGERIFMDPSLSASGKMSCASCHSPRHAFGPPNVLPVQLGGADLRQPGIRAVPSLTYLQAAPHFTEHFFDSDDEGDESVDNGPTGGLTWDGRVDRGADQARLPLLSPFEMANVDPASVAAKLRAAPYAADLAALTGADLADPQRALAAAAAALEAFEEDFSKFYPYSSKYDLFLAGRAQLTPPKRMGSTSSTTRKRATASAAISAPAGATALRRSSPTTASSPSACRATPPSRSTPTRPISTSVSAAPSAPTSRTIPNTAAPS